MISIIKTYYSFMNSLFIRGSKFKISQKFLWQGHLFRCLGQFYVGLQNPIKNSYAQFHLLPVSLRQNSQILKKWFFEIQFIIDYQCEDSPQTDCFAHPVHVCDLKTTKYLQVNPVLLDYLEKPKWYNGEAHSIPMIIVFALANRQWNCFQNCFWLQLFFQFLFYYLFFKAQSII